MFEDRWPTARSARRAEAAARAVAKVGVGFAPVGPHDRNDDALRDAIARFDGHGRGREVQHLDFDFISRPAIVRIDDADAVGNDETAFERRAAAREDAEEMP